MKTIRTQIALWHAKRQENNQRTQARSVLRVIRNETRAAARTARAHTKRARGLRLWAAWSDPANPGYQPARPQLLLLTEPAERTNMAAIRSCLNGIHLSRKAA